MAMNGQQTVLRVLIRQRHLSYGSFCREWDRIAKGVDETLKGRYPAHAQYYRWLRGELAKKRPYPDACRMLEAMFPGWSTEKLFSPYREEVESLAGSAISSVNKNSTDGVVSETKDYPEAHATGGATKVTRLESPTLHAALPVLHDLSEIEALRQQMNELFGDAMSEASIEEWERIAIRYAKATRDRAAGILLGDISQDLAELNRAIERQRSVQALRRLTRVAAQMSGLMLLIFCLLDDRHAFRRWARTASLAGNEAGDPETLSWILAQEAYGHYYAGDISEAVDVSRRASEIVSLPCSGAALALALEARAYAIMGRAQETRRALEQAEQVLSQLNGDDLIPSAFGYNEASFRFHEGNAYTHLRDVKSAMRAQDRALELCAPDNYTDWAMTRLDRAQCLVYTGDIASGFKYAAETITRLSGPQRDGIILLRGQRIMETLPEGEGKLRQFASSASC